MKKLLLLCAVIVAACTSNTVTIVQIADTQLGFDAAVKGSVPGTEYVNDLTFEVECLKAAVAKVNEIKPDVVVFTGDQVHVPADAEQWDAFMQVIDGIDPSIKVYHLPGNHDHVIVDDKADPTDFISRFGADRFFANASGVNLVGLNTSLIYFNSESEQEQAQWLESVLDETDRDDVTLIFGHHPYFCEDIDEDDTHVQVPKSKRRQYFEMFVEKGVDAVFAGHLHDNRTAEYDGLPMLTTTSSGYQLGEAHASVRLITVLDGKVTEKLLEL